MDECTSLENWHTFTGIVGSNPTPSASMAYHLPYKKISALVADTISNGLGINNGI